MLKALVFLSSSLGCWFAAPWSYGQDEDALAYPFQLMGEAEEAEREAKRQSADYEANLQRQLPGLNASIGRITRERESLEARIAFFNNIGELKTQSSLDEWVKAKRQEWDAKSGRRIGVINPYDGNSFYRYYNRETRDDDGKLVSGGELVVQTAKGDFETLQQAAKAWDQSYKRAKWAAESLDNDYKRVAEQYGRATALKAQSAAAQSAAVQQKQQSRPPAEGPASGGDDGYPRRVNGVLVSP